MDSISFGEVGQQHFDLPVSAGRRILTVPSGRHRFRIPAWIQLEHRVFRRTSRLSHEVPQRVALWAAVPLREAARLFPPFPRSIGDSPANTPTPENSSRLSTTRLNTTKVFLLCISCSSQSVIVLSSWRQYPFRVSSAYRLYHLLLDTAPRSHAALRELRLRSSVCRNCPSGRSATPCP